MNELIAVCSKKSCGHIFQVENFSGRDAQIAVGKNNVGVKCPNCGQLAYLNQGIYGIQKDAIRLMSGPRESFEQLQRIKQLLENSAKTANSKEEILKQVASESPRIAEFLKNINGDTFHKWLTQAIAIMGLVVATYAAFKPDDKDDEEISKLLIKHLQTELNEAKQRTSYLQSSTEQSDDIFQERQEISNEPIYIGGGDIVIRDAHFLGPVISGYSPNQPHKALLFSLEPKDEELADFIFNINEIIIDYKLNSKNIHVLVAGNSQVSSELMKINSILTKSGFNLIFNGTCLKGTLGPNPPSGIYLTGIPQDKPTKMYLVFNKNANTR